MQSSASGSEVLVQAHHLPLQFQPESPRMLSGPQPHLPTLTNPRASQTNPNIGLSQLPAHFQYLPYPHSQQPQVRNCCELFFCGNCQKTYICTAFFSVFLLSNSWITITEPISKNVSIVQCKYQKYVWLYLYPACCLGSAGLFWFEVPNPHLINFSYVTLKQVFMF